MLRRAARQAGFTLIELLVVIAIIVLLTAISIPALTQFLKGRKLEDAGRIVQSAFNEARRAAITTRRNHYLVIFKAPPQEASGGEVVQFKIFREGEGYDPTPAFALPQGIQMPMTVTNAGAAEGTAFGTLTDSGAVVFKGAPPDQNDPTYFTPTLQPQTGALGWIAFRRDGTVEFLNPASNQNTPQVGGRSIYDLNEIFDEGEVGTGLLSDFKLVQLGETKKMGYIDVTPNTGRVSFRVVNTGGGVIFTVP